MPQRFKSAPCFNFQECFNPFLDIDTVPERPKNIPPYNSRNQSSLGELLLGFLKYYATSFRYLPPSRPPRTLEFQNPCVLFLPACFPFSSCSGTLPANSLHLALFLAFLPCILWFLCLWLSVLGRWCLWPPAAPRWRSMMLVFSLWLALICQECRMSECHTCQFPN